MAVVEGYTDVIAAHQVGLGNVVGTLGTALGDDHVLGLRRLADRVVLVFDGDEAGQTAADRSLELFLGHEVDVRVLTLPADLDPCDFLLKEGAEAFRALVDAGGRPAGLRHRAGRGAVRPRLARGARGRRPSGCWRSSAGSPVAASGSASDVKVAKALDTPGAAAAACRSRPSSGGSGSCVAAAGRSRAATRPPASPATSSAGGRLPGQRGRAGAAPAPPIRLADLDPVDRELIQIVLNEPGAVADLISRVAGRLAARRPAAAILQACYDLHGEGQSPTLRAGHASARRPRGPGPGGRPALCRSTRRPCPRTCVPPPGKIGLSGVLATLAERERQDRLRDLGRPWPKPTKSPTRTRIVPYD